MIFLIGKSKQRLFETNQYELPQKKNILNMSTADNVDTFSILTISINGMTIKSTYE